jgi:hypothetical protein
MSNPSARLPVVSPSFTPLPYGLLSVVGLPSESTPHWRNGVWHQPDACGEALSTIDPCPPITGLGKSPSATGIPAMGSDPFTVYAWVDCGPVSVAEPEAMERARNALLNGEGRTIESVFWTGDVTPAGAPDINPHLAEDTAIIETDGVISQLAVSPVTTGSSAVDVVEAIGLLEGALADCYGGVGVIHVPRTALAHLASKTLVVVDGDQLRTVGGNLVAAGAGYPGTSPTGANPAVGHGWFYATGSVDLRRSDIRFTSTYAEAVDKAENSLVLIAERTYVITWDCCLFGANVRLGGDDTGAVFSAD